MSGAPLSSPSSRRDSRRSAPLIANQWILEHRIGSGSFGEVFYGSHVHTDEKVAIKLERPGATQLVHEADIYKRIGTSDGIAQMKHCGIHKNKNIVVMELLGPSLEQLFTFCDRKFSLKTVCMLGIQMLNVIQRLHEKGVIHRDIKPENFLVGRDPTSMNKIHLVDFGLAKVFRDLRGKHIRITGNNSIIGNLRYASVSNTMGLEQSRRDDLESIGYMLVYFLRGCLPWQGIRKDMASQSERVKKVAEMKVTTTATKLTSGLPNEMANFLNYTKSLGFEEDPEYDYLRGLLKEILSKNHWSDDRVFDWLHSVNPIEVSTHKLEEAVTLRAKTAPEADGTTDSHEAIPVTEEESNALKKTHSAHQIKSSSKEGIKGLCSSVRITNPDVLAELRAEALSEGSSETNENHESHEPVSPSTAEHATLKKEKKTHHKKKKTPFFRVMWSLLSPREKPTS